MHGISSMSIDRFWWMVTSNLPRSWTKWYTKMEMAQLQWKFHGHPCPVCKGWITKFGIDPCFFNIFVQCFPLCHFHFLDFFPILTLIYPSFFNSAALDTQMTEACCQLMVCRATVDSTLNSCRSCRNCPGRRCLSSRPSGRWGETGYTNDRINVAIKSH